MLLGSGATRRRPLTFHGDRFLFAGRLKCRGVLRSRDGRRPASESFAERGSRGEMPGKLGASLVDV